MTLLQPTQLRSSRPRDWLLFLLRRRWRFRVTGRSMLPLLSPGQEVLVNPTAYHNPTDLPQLGDIVIAYHPHRPGLRLIKYVAWHTEAGYFLQGLNPAESSDSREFGPVGREQLLGQVICRFP